MLLSGEGLEIESLELDGALVIKAGEGARVSVRGLKVSNRGWGMMPLPQDPSQVTEEDRWAFLEMGRDGRRLRGWRGNSRFSIPFFFPPHPPYEASSAVLEWNRCVWMEAILDARCTEELFPLVHACLLFSLE